MALVERGARAVLALVRPSEPLGAILPRITSGSILVRVALAFVEILAR